MQRDGVRRGGKLTIIELPRASSYRALLRFVSDATVTLVALPLAVAGIRRRRPP
jgi:hypothetical protein